MDFLGKSSYNYNIGKIIKKGKPMKYETNEVIYTIREENSLYYVNAFFKETGDDEEDFFVLDKNFNFISYPPLTAINRVVEKKYKNIPDAINAYEKFIEENY